MKFSGLALATVTLALSATALRAEDYPSRPVHIIVPYTPGASTDLLARATADVASEIRDHIRDRSRPGAGTALGTRVVKAAADDGYTILFQATNFLNNLHTLKEPGYTIDDFTEVGLLGQTAYVLLIPSSVPAKNLKSSSTTPRRKTASSTTPRSATAHASSCCPSI